MAEDQKLTALWQLLQDSKKTGTAPRAGVAPGAAPQAQAGHGGGDGGAEGGVKPPKPEIIKLAKKGRVEELAAYIREHPEAVNEIHPHHGSALHKAVQTRSYDKVALLLEAGADPNLWERPLQDEKARDFPPLFTAFAGQDLTLLRLLALSKHHKLDFNIRGPGGRHGLHHAIIIARDNEAGDPVVIIEEYFKLAAAANVKIEMDSFSESVYNKTPLHISCGSNFLGTVHLLLQQGANPNPQDLDGWKEHPAVIRLLLAHGASMDIRSTDRNNYLPSEMDISDRHCKTAFLMGRTSAAFTRRSASGQL